MTFVSSSLSLIFNLGASFDDTLSYLCFNKCHSPLIRDLIYINLGVLGFAREPTGVLSEVE